MQVRKHRTRAPTSFGAKDNRGRRGSQVVLTIYRHARWFLFLSGPIFRVMGSTADAKSTRSGVSEGFMTASNAEAVINDALQHDEGRDLSA